MKKGMEIKDARIWTMVAGIFGLLSAVLTIGLAVKSYYLDYPFEFNVYAPVDAAFATVFSVFLIWKRSRVAAILLLGCYIGSRLLTIRSQITGYGLPVALFFISVFVQGVRGATAYQRLKRNAMADVEKIPDKRPIVLVIATILLFLSAVYNLLLGIHLFLSVDYASVPFFGSGLVLFYINQIAGGFICFVFAFLGGIGVLLITRWGWILGMVAPIIGIFKILASATFAFMLTKTYSGIVLIVLGIIQPMGWVLGIVLQVVIIILLLKARKHFIAKEGLGR